MLTPTASLSPPNREYQPCTGPGEKQGAKNLAVDASTLTVRRLAFCRSLHLRCSGGGLFGFVLGRTTPPSWPELFHMQRAATTALGEKNRCQHILFLYLVKKIKVYIYTQILLLSSPSPCPLFSGVMRSQTLLFGALQPDSRCPLLARDPLQHQQQRLRAGPASSHNHNHTATAAPLQTGSSMGKLKKAEDDFWGSGRVRHAESLGRNDTGSSNKKQYFAHPPRFKSSQHLARCALSLPTAPQHHSPLPHPPASFSSLKIKIKTGVGRNKGR